jgi:hypothetical protein
LKLSVAEPIVVNTVSKVTVSVEKDGMASGSGSSSRRLHDTVSATMRKVTSVLNRLFLKGAVNMQNEPGMMQNGNVFK